MCINTFNSVAKGYSPVTAYTDENAYHFLQMDFVSRIFIMSSQFSVVDYDRRNICTTTKPRAG